MDESIHDSIQAEMIAREGELIELHRRLVRIQTINRGDGASANEDKFAIEAAEYLEGRSIVSRQVESAPGRANLLAEIGGDGGGRSILWMSHSDVVAPGDESAWTHPPFSGEMADGRIWGRGSNDCKMLTACQMFAMAILARMGLPGRGRVRLAVGADEEVGGKWGFGWLAEHHADFLRADLAIGEGGGACLGRFDDGRPVVSLGTGEKGRYEVVFTVRASGGHACSPWGKANPVATMAEISRRIEAWRPRPLAKSPIFKRVAHWLGLARGVNTKNIERAIEQIAGRDDPRANYLANSLRGQSRMTLTPTMVQAGEKSNAIATDGRLICDARTLPGQTVEDLRRVADGIAQGLDGVEVAIETTTGPSVSDVDPALAELFERSATRALGAAVEVAPTWCVGATDARWVRSVGTPVYGFQLVHPDADHSRLGIHCIDESIETRMLLPCALSLAHLAVEFIE